MAAEGRAMGHHEGKVIFVDYAMPGDILKVRTTKNKKDFAIASILEIIEASPDRQEAICEHFEVCGGCKSLHIPYNKQLEYKQLQVEEAFQRIGHLEYPKIQTILGAKEIYHYRNKMEYTFSNRGWLTQDQIDSGADIDRRALGLHVPGRYDGVLHLNQCHLQDVVGNEIRSFIYDLAIQNDFTFYNVKAHEGFLRNIIMRNNIEGEWMITISFGENKTDEIELILKALKEQFPTITSLNYVINEKKNDTLYDLDIINYYGEAYLTESLGKVKYKIGPKSFFQTNSQQAKSLYDVVNNMLNIQAADTVYDLYTGIGSIALYVAQTAQKVIGIETIGEAIEDANLNVDINQINNATFIEASVEKILDEDFIKTHGQPDIVITDPPRVGMHPKVIEVLLQAQPKQIVYVSCNPATQARDLNLLAEKYDIIEVQPVDMFPNTYHIENIVNLGLKA